MAEIKDIYTLEFNGDSFNAEIQRSLALVEEYQAALQDASLSGEDLAAAQEDLAGSLSDLENVLKKDVKSVDDLNTKQKVLSQTQKTLSKDSAAYTAVAKETTETQGKLAKQTAENVKNNKSLAGSVVDGARKLNSLKRAAGVLTGVFRLLGALNPVALALTALPTVIGFFSGLTSSTDKAKQALEKLNDPSLSLSQRADILKEEIDRLNEIEKATGALTDEEKKQRDELRQKYEETSDQIIKIEEERLKKITDLQNEAARIRVKLLGDSVAGIIENFKVESKILFDEAGKSGNALIKEINDLAQKRDDALRSSNFARAREIDEQIRGINEQIDANNELIRAKKAELAQEKALALQRKAEEAARKKDEADKKKAAEEEAARRKRLEQERLALSKRIQAEIFDVVAKGGDAIFNNQAINAEKERQLRIKNFNDFNDLENKRLAVLTAQRETETARQLLLLEQQRNAELAAALESGQEQEEILKQQQKINENYNNQRAEIERLTNAEILESRIDLLQSLVEAAKQAGADTVELEKELADLRLKLEELNKPVNIEVDADTGQAESKLKTFLDDYAGLFQQVTDDVFNLLSQQAAALTNRLDQAVQRSETALNEIRSNSEDFNAQQLAIEKQRLQDLQAARERAAKREATIAQIQVAANAAVAIAKAAAEGGIAAPFTIAATLISLIAGFAAARNAASGAFFEGTEFLERNGAPKGRDTIVIRAHEGERIIPTANNMQYWDAYSAMQNEHIPANIANIFAKGYKNNGLQGAIFNLQKVSGATIKPDVNLGNLLGNSAMFFVSAPSGNGQLECKLDELKDEIKKLPSKMPVSDFSLDANGFHMKQRKFIEKQQIRKGRAS